jgi:hypothetical protein
MSFLDDKAGSAKNITVKDEASSKPTVKDEASSKPTVKNEASSKPTAGPVGPFAAKPFDWSLMSNLLSVSYFLLSCVIFILCVVSAMFTDN